MRREELPAVFVTHAASILGDTNLGLTGSRIVALTSAYAIDANVEIPHSTYPFSTTNINKRTALADNILAFPSKWRYKIIKELCDNSAIQSSQHVGRNNRRALRRMLVPRYYHHA